MLVGAAGSTVLQELRITGARRAAVKGIARRRVTRVRIVMI
jgi:hypothetical protein